MQGFAANQGDPVSIELFVVVMFLSAIGAGMLGSLVGLGGGILIVPILTIGFGVDIHLAIGASIISVIATSSGAAAAFVRDHMTNIRVAMLLELATSVGAVSAAELAGMLGEREAGRRDFVLVDVREPGEREVVSIPGALAVHLDRFRDGTAAADLPSGIPVVVHCKSGARSAEAAALLAGTGRGDVANLTGGILAWVRDVDPSLPVY